MHESRTIVKIVKFGTLKIICPKTAKVWCYKAVMHPKKWGQLFNPIAFRKAKIVYSFGLSECNRVQERKNLLLLKLTLPVKSKPH